MAMPVSVEWPPGSEGHPPILTNLVMLDWLRRSEEMMSEHKMTNEKWQQFQNMQVERSAQHQKSIEQLLERFTEHQMAIAQLLETHFARVESLHFDTSQSLQNEFHRLMHNPTRHVGAVDSPTGGAPVSKASDASSPVVASVLAPCEDMDLEQAAKSGNRLVGFSPALEKNAGSREWGDVREQSLAFSPETYNRLSKPPNTRFASFMESDIVNLVVGGLITANAIVSSIAISIRMHSVLKNPPESPNTAVFAAVANAFAFVFAAEVCLRIVALRMSYFFGEDWRWNLFDVVLVVNSIVERVFVSSSRQMLVMRIMRLFRVTRIFRIIRVLRYFSDLRLLICSLTASVMSLLWAVALVTLIIYIAAVVFMQGLLSHLEELDPTTAAEFMEQSQIREWYSSIPRTMYSLLMAVSGGKPWSVFSAPLEASSPTLPVLFCALVIFIGYGVSSIIVGVFVDRTAEVSNKDLQLTLNREVDKVETFLRHVRFLFHKAGWKRKDIITSEEFTQCLRDRTILFYLTSHGIDVPEAKAVFENLLDHESSAGGITVDDFAYGCMQRMGQAKSTDVHILLEDTRRILDSAIRTDQNVREQNTMLAACVNTLTSQFAIVRHELEELHHKH